MENHNITEHVLNCIAPRIRNVLMNIPCNDIQEIRLRNSGPVVIVNSYGSSFVTKNGRLTQILSDQCIYSAEYEITDTLNKCCGYSLHTHTKDLLNGFVTIPSGARVGVCGTAVYENGKIKSVKDISSVNIRIPRNVKGASDEIIKAVFNHGLQNLLIVGPPSSGKTTIIKDLAYQISDGRLGKYYKVCVADERMEISGSREFLGPNTDVIKGYPKAKAIDIAVRTMSPEVIICDEVGFNGETDEILHGINCGVKFIITAHANEYDFNSRNDLLSLCKIGQINKIVFLSGSNMPGKVKRIVNCNELLENIRNNTDASVRNTCEPLLYKAN